MHTAISGTQQRKQSLNKHPIYTCPSACHPTSGTTDCCWCFVFLTQAIMMIFGNPPSFKKAYSMNMHIQFIASHYSVKKFPKPKSKKNKITNFNMDTNELIHPSPFHCTK
ncbi:hypothetical protein CRENBAI_020742 [Crenichthys baileyi]|uniref:Uncharacterized protein n=1 Tax=Crenichthys baileyi TaxID=28760 RepID=A0AAV9R382_9TELE